MAIEIRPIVIEWGGIRLEPLQPGHARDLAIAAADGRLWELKCTSVPDPEGTRAYIDEALAGQAAGTMLPWAVRDLATGRIAGSTRYHDIVAEIDRLEIGYTWYGQSWQRTRVNSTCKRILLAHAFETIGCRVVGFRTDILNTTSQRAIEALGARRDGILRHHQPRRDGSVRDSVIYSILADEWPRVRQHLDNRLDRHAIGGAVHADRLAPAKEISLALPGEAEIVAALMVRQIEEHALPVDHGGISAAVAAIVNDPHSGCFLLARRGHDVVGAAFVAFIQSAEHGGRSAWLEEIYVVPALRGRGIGGRLVREAVRMAKDMGCRAMDLEVTEDHRRAAHLYEREGFEPLHRMRWTRRL